MGKILVSTSHVGLTVVDSKTGEEWIFLGWTHSQSNYSCAKIKNNKDGTIRKLSPFADEGSSRDIHRYIVKETNI